jgi:DNA-binding response OmpR family regulator
LIVDRSEATREVLTTALERRGFRVLSAGRAWQGAELARFHQPDVVVLDLDSLGRTAEAAYARAAPELVDDPARSILLGTRRPADRALGRRFVRKPYHYGPLIRRIEEVSGAAEPALARCA